MDSGNSGSLQSSSDDEFDSGRGVREDSSPLSALLRQPPSSALHTGFTGSVYGVQDDLAAPPLCHWSSSTPLPADDATAGVLMTALPSSCQAPVGQGSAGPAPPVAAPPRGARKRTRASRRAPTTVLTTDTSNFHAMVQEFTGIPAPPFAACVPGRRPRFDHLFPSRAAGCPAAALSPYLLRPFTTSAPAAKKAIASSTTTLSTTAGAYGDRYRLASAPSSVLGMQDHGSGNYPSFQSPMGAQLDSNASRYRAVRPTFDAARPLYTQRLPDRAGFMVPMNSRHRHHGHGGDELSELVGAVSVSICKTTTTTPVTAGAATTTTMLPGAVAATVATSE